MASGMVVTIDIKDFTGVTAEMNPERIANYLLEFYAFVYGLANRLGFTPVKCMGDSVLLLAPESDDKLRSMYAEVAQRYPVQMSHRICEFTRSTVRMGDYQCHDIFGRDINQLFAQDEDTVVLG